MDFDEAARKIKKGDFLTPHFCKHILVTVRYALYEFIQKEYPSGEISIDDFVERFIANDGTIDHMIRSSNTVVSYLKDLEHLGFAEKDGRNYHFTPLGLEVLELLPPHDYMKLLITQDGTFRRAATALFITLGETELVKIGKPIGQTKVSVATSVRKLAEKKEISYTKKENRKNVIDSVSSTVKNGSEMVERLLKIQKIFTKNEDSYNQRKSGRQVNIIPSAQAEFLGGFGSYDSDYECRPPSWNSQSRAGAVVDEVFGLDEIVSSTIGKFGGFGIIEPLDNGTKSLIIVNNSREYVRFLFQILRDQTHNFYSGVPLKGGCRRKSFIGYLKGANLKVVGISEETIETLCSRVRKRNRASCY